MSSNKSPSYWAVVPAAGSGSRMRSSRPKQYLPLLGSAVIEWSLAPLLRSHWIKGVVVVLAPQDRRFGKLDCARDPRVVTAIGGATRAESVIAGLRAIPAAHPPSTYALVHDAARPCVKAADLQRLRDAASDRQGGLLAAPAVDTLKRVGKGQRALATLDRSQVWQAQTPQMFRLDLLLAALEAGIRKNLAITDEASAMEAAGYRPRLVEASGNPKLTYPADLKLAEFWLRQRGRK